MAASANRSEAELGALSYIGLRRGIGLIALALPVVLPAGHAVLDDTSWPGSISAYYYTDMRNVFVGALCALAVFLFSYRYQRTDNRLSTAGAFFAAGVALFPTATEGSTTTGEEIVRAIHLFCALSFFLILAWFSLRIFTRSEGEMTPRKQQRNKIYRVCGVMILLALLAAAVNMLIGRGDPDYWPDEYNALFWFETVAVLAFATSWMVKGGFWLTDEPAARHEVIDLDSATAVVPDAGQTTTGSADTSGADARTDGALTQATSSAPVGTSRDEGQAHG